MGYKKFKLLSILLIIIFILIFSGCTTSNNQIDNLSTNSIIVVEPTPAPTPTPISVNRVRFSASGDNLIHGAIYLQAQRRAQNTDKKYDFDYLYQNVTGFLSDYDINFINQETLVNDILEPSTYPMFSTPGELGKSAYAAGYRVFGQSNNHTYDRGAIGISATNKFWQAMPNDVVTTGLYSDETLFDIKTNTVNDITFSYLAYTQYTNGLPTPQDAESYIIYTSQEDLIEQQIKKAREVSDFVVVSVHWGNEDSHIITDGQRALAKKMVDWGCDIIIGTHPHVIQNLEWITAADGRKAICAYSLGNFVSAQSKPDQMLGYVLSFEAVKKGEEKYIENVSAIPTINHYNANYRDIRVYILKDYTQELLHKHGVRTEYPYFDFNYIKGVYTENVSQEFLDFSNIELI